MKLNTKNNNITYKKRISHNISENATSQSDYWVAFISIQHKRKEKERKSHIVNLFIRMSFNTLIDNVLHDFSSYWAHILFILFTKKVPPFQCEVFVLLRTFFLKNFLRFVTKIVFKCLLLFYKKISKLNIKRS